MRPRGMPGVVIGAWASLIACLAYGTHKGGLLGVAAGSLLVLVCAVPLIDRLRVDPLDALGLYGLVTAVFFGVFSLGWLGEPPVPAPGIDRGDVGDSLLLVAGSLIVFMVVGTVVFGAAPRPQLSFPAEQRPARWILVAGFVFSLVGTFVGLAVGAIGFGKASAGSGVGGASQVLNQVANVGSLTVLACALSVFGTADRRDLRLLVILLVAQAAAGFAFGFKGASLLPLVFTGIAYIAARGRVPWRAVGAVALAAIVLLLPGNVLYRDVLRPAPGRTIHDATPAAIVERSYQYIGSRFRLIDHVALIRNRTPSQYPWGGGRRYLQLPAIVLVPRAVWSEKPTLDDGEEFSLSYWEVSPDLRTSTPITAIGDLYRNFGLPGPLIGLGIWALVVAAFTLLCRRWRSPRAEMIYIAGLVSWVIYIETDLPQLIALMARTVPVTIALAWLLLPGRSGECGYRALLRHLPGPIRGRLGLPGEVAAAGPSRASG